MIGLRPGTIIHLAVAGFATFYTLELASTLIGPDAFSEAGYLIVFVVFFTFLWIVKNLKWLAMTIIKTAVYAFIALNVKRFFFNRKA